MLQESALSLLEQDTELLKKQRDELVGLKRDKERELESRLEMMSGDKISKSRDSLYAKKAEKEKQLEKVRKYEQNSLRSSGGRVSGKSLSGSKKRGRSSKRSSDSEEVDIRVPKRSKLNSSDTFQSVLPQSTLSRAILEDKQFQEIKKEHKRSRQLIKDQYREFEILSKYTFQRLDYLQQCLHLVMADLNIPIPQPVSVQVVDESHETTSIPPKNRNENIISEIEVEPEQTLDHVSSDQPRQEESQETPKIEPDTIATEDSKTQLMITEVSLDPTEPIHTPEIITHAAQ